MISSQYRSLIPEFLVAHDLFCSPNIARLKKPWLRLIFRRSTCIKIKKTTKREESSMQKRFIIAESIVEQWIARWTSNPEIAGPKPAEDDFGFRRFSLIGMINLNQKLFHESKTVCVSHKRWSKWAMMRFLSKNSQTIMQQKKSIDNCSGKKTHNQKQNLQRFFVQSNSVQMTNFSGQAKIPIRKFKIRRQASIVQSTAK